MGFSIFEFKAFRNSLQPPINKLISKTKTMVRSIQNNYFFKTEHHLFSTKIVVFFFCLLHRKEEIKAEAKILDIHTPHRNFAKCALTSLYIESLILKKNVCLETYSDLP